jgi:hypothetical protein
MKEDLIYQQSVSISVSCLYLDDSRTLREIEKKKNAVPEGRAFSLKVLRGLEPLRLLRRAGILPLSVT